MMESSSDHPPSIELISISPSLLFISSSEPEQFCTDHNWFFLANYSYKFSPFFCVCVCVFWFILLVIHPNFLLMKEWDIIVTHHNMYNMVVLLVLRSLQLALESFIHYYSLQRNISHHSIFVFRKWGYTCCRLILITSFSTKDTLNIYSRVYYNKLPQGQLHQPF